MGERLKDRLFINIINYKFNPIGMYYLRSRPAADPIKFTVDVEALLKDGGKIDIKS